MSEPTVTPAASAAAEQPRTRKPIDPAAREAASKRAVARKLAKKLGAAKDADEFWQLADDLAAKAGRKLEKPTPAAEADPKDKPMQPGWPTVREVEKAKDVADAALMQIAELAKGTRYEEPATGAQVSCAVPLAACIAKYAADIEMGPGPSLAVAAAFAFGPTAAGHAWEVLGPRVVAWWHRTTPPAVEATPTKPADVVQLDKKAKGA